VCAATASGIAAAGFGSVTLTSLFAGGGAAGQETLRQISENQQLLNRITSKLAEMDQGLSALRARGNTGACNIREALIMNAETRMAEVRALIDSLGSR